MRVFVAIVVTIVVIAVIGLIYIYSGLFNVSAAGPVGKMEDWVLSTTMDNSVERHAKNIIVPSLVDSAQIALGFDHFREMCVTCHGAPGVEPSYIGKGLNPEAPNLTEAAGEWNDAELYWIVKNGIKMTGMPSFGKTHSEAALWAMVAFVRLLPKMTPEEYQSLSSTHAVAEGDEGEVESEPGEHEHH